MKIKDIEIKGWRSFDLDGSSLKDLKKNNIFIGQNNAGKSNISKYFMRLKEIANTANVNSDDKKNYTSYQKITKKLDPTDRWAWLDGDITCRIQIEIEQIKDSGYQPFYSDNITLVTSHTSDDINNLYVEVAGNQLLTLTEPHQIYDKENDHHVDLNASIDGIGDSFFLWKKFLNSLIFIDPIRHYERESKTSDNAYFDGAKIVKELDEIKTNNRKEWVGYKKKIKSWLSKITNEEIDDIDVHENRFSVDVFRGKEQLSATLDELGTGVSQIVMLLSHLYLNREKSLNVFIDEPESNLHPDAVIKLIEIFDSELSNHSFFITTHSSVLIDQIGESWSIHRFSRKSSEASSVFPCSNLVQKREVLDELGIRASQILQANLVIWVEGPSDAIYVKKWISDKSNGSLIDGKHYSFIFYGGANLTSHDILAEDDTLIDFLFTSRYVVIFCDTDCKSRDEFESENFKGRVRDTLSRLEDMNKALIGHKRSLKEFVHIWLTDGRETENYVPFSLLKKTLSSKPFVKSWVNEIKNKKSQRVILKTNQSLMDDSDFGEFDSFDVAFSKMYEREDGVVLDDKIRSAIASKYSKDKVKISKEIVKGWEDHHYDPALSQSIEHIVKMINSSNGI